jgi:hypothetical protein
VAELIRSWSGGGENYRWLVLGQSGHVPSGRRGAPPRDRDPYRRPPISTDYNDFHRVIRHAGDPALRHAPLLVFKKTTALRSGMRSFCIAIFQLENRCNRLEIGGELFPLFLKILKKQKGSDQIRTR